jgi:hypothetical protein
VLPFEQGVEVESQRQFDGLACGTRRRDDDDPAMRVGRMAEGIGIGRKMMIAGGMHGGE